jgi:hypothetical protein
MADRQQPSTSLARPDRAAVARTRDVRERAIARLSDAFAHDELDVAEFERRVTVAHTAESPAELEALLADLQPGRAMEPAPPPVAQATALARAAAGEVQAEQKAYAIMGGIDRRGAWTVPRKLKLVMMMGGAYLDLREARFPAGPVDLHVFAFMGGAEIIVPPGLAVQTDGSAFMGGFQDVNRAPAVADPDAPLLRVHGMVVMGGVDIRTALPGEPEGPGHSPKRLERDKRRALPAKARDDE